MMIKLCKKATCNYITTQDENRCFKAQGFIERGGGALGFPTTSQNSPLEI